VFLRLASRKTLISLSWSLREGSRTILGILEFLFLGSNMEDSRNGAAVWDSEPFENCGGEEGVGC
jgi:hypothetical protein